MKKPLATRSISYSVGASSRSQRSGVAWAAVGVALLALLVCLAGDLPAQTAIARRDTAIAQWGPPRSIDKARLVRGGFRVLDGRHITLVTDLPSTTAVDELPQVVDAAVPLLAARFGIDARQVRDWRVLAMVISDREKFAAAGLMPTGNEAFPDGLSLGYEVWVADQPSDYYRRHLLLHEVVHSFMATQLGSCGPGWYMEGMAELLGTHAWDPRTQKLAVGVMPGGRDAYPMWGRTKLVRDAVADGRLLPIASVMRIDNRQALEVESYAWVWASPSSWIPTLVTSGGFANCRTTRSIRVSTIALSTCLPPTAPTWRPSGGCLPPPWITVTTSSGKRSRLLLAGRGQCGSILPSG